MNVHRSFLRQESQKKVVTYKSQQQDKWRNYEDIIRGYYDILLYMKKTASRLIHWKGENDRIENVEVTFAYEDREHRCEPVRTSFDSSHTRRSFEKNKKTQVVPIIE